MAGTLAREQAGGGVGVRHPWIRRSSCACNWGASVDQLVQGSEVEITLAPDGTTTGRVFVPRAGEDGGDLDADLTGTWALSRGGVTFDQTADTFIRDVRFTADRNRLIGKASLGHPLIDLVLTKTE